MFVKVTNMMSMRRMGWLSTPQDPAALRLIKQKGPIMKIGALRYLALAAAIGFASSAFAGVEGLEGLTQKTITMKDGKTVTVMVGKMHDKTMVVIPEDELNELFMRAEGHSMNYGP